MSEIKVVNRIQELASALESIGTKRSRQDAARRALETVDDDALDVLRRTAPKGKSEPSFQLSHTHQVSHGRPSKRLGHGRLEDQWARPEIGDLPAGAEVIFSSNAPHMRLLLEGAPRHPLEANQAQVMTFWWFRKQVGMALPYLPKDHPGFESRIGFIEEALEGGGRALFEQAVRNVAPDLIGPIRRFFE